MPKKKRAASGYLEDLLKWNKRPFLDKMLDDGESPYKCAMWCKENGFPISSPTMYQYAKKRKEAIVNGLVAEIMPPPPENPEPIPKKTTKRQKKAQEMANMERKTEHQTFKKVKHDMELLDEIIQKGFETLKMMDAVNPAVAVKAVELKQKITGGAHGGHTVYGIEEIRLREAARENAIVTILLEYIPEEKHSEVLERMEKATMDYYESIGLGNAYKQHNVVDVEGGAVNE
jgi:hypothetical protein